MEIEKYFSDVNDPRDQSKISHLLTDIIGLSLIGTLAGCEGYEDIEEFGARIQELSATNRPSRFVVWKHKIITD